MIVILCTFIIILLLLLHFEYHVRVFWVWKSELYFASRPICLALTSLNFSSFQWCFFIRGEQERYDICRRKAHIICVSFHVNCSKINEYNYNKCAIKANSIHHRILVDSLSKIKRISANDLNLLCVSSCSIKIVCSSSLYADYVYSYKN